MRLFKRTTHNGIVGARNRGAKEAVHDIIVFLDSHSEVTPGWLPPLVSRIHGDRTRVVIPALHPIGLDTLRVSGYGNGWPPSKGSFNWKLGFTIVPADVAADVIPINGSKRAGAVRTPVMPGGLFAMDRAFFFEIGDDVGYDPEILYYGAEHVELSFRVWMCGGTMENIPCSHVGHVYRNFDRFAVDPSLENVDVGKALNRNDMRVAEVWLDEYKALFYQARGLAGKPFGDISKRVAMRKRLQCKSFEWYLKNVHPEQYIPELDPVQTGMVGAPNKKLCLDSMQRKFGPIGLYGCHGWGNQRWNLGKKGLLYTVGEMICLRASVAKGQGAGGADVIQAIQTKCPNGGANDDKTLAFQWEYTSGTIRPKAFPGTCLDRTGLKGGQEPTCKPCIAAHDPAENGDSALGQQWVFAVRKDTGRG